MSKVKLFALLMVLVLVVSGCAAPAPAAPVKETVVVEKEKVVTAAPEQPKYDENSKIVVWTDTTRQVALDIWKKKFPDKANLIDVVLVDRAQFPAKVLLFNNTGSGWPDLVFAEPSIVAQVADAAHNFPMDLKDSVSQDIIKGFPEAALAPCWFDGKLFCLRNDVAQDVLYYNKPLMDQFGYKVPTTWEEYQDLSDQVAKDHPGYIMGAFGDQWAGWANYFWPSECPVNEVLGVSQVRINALDPKCVRAAQLVDHMLNNGTMARTDPFDPAFVKIANDNKLLMLIDASWFAQYIFGGKPDSLYYKTADHQLGTAAPLKWKDQAQAITGAHGGSAWTVSRHTKNPKLAVDLAIWLTTSSDYHGTGPTYPAYSPAAEAWAKTVQGDALYANDPIPVFKDATPLISKLDNQPRYDWGAAIVEIIKTTNKNKTPFADALKDIQAKLVPLAEAQGYEVVTK